MLEFHVIGMKHSGSTLCFRLIQSLCRSNGYSIPSSDDLPLSGDSPPNDLPVARVNKSHNAGTAASCGTGRKVQYILTVRDVRDAAISNFFRFHLSKDHPHAADIVNLYGTRPLERSMVENIRLYQRGLLHTPVIFCYEEYQRDPLRTLHGLQRFLFHRPQSDEELSRVIQSVQLSNAPPLVKNLRVYYEEKNQGHHVPLLMHDHNTSHGAVKKYESFLSPRQHALVLENEMIKCWLKINGYPIALRSGGAHDEIA